MKAETPNGGVMYLYTHVSPPSSPIIKEQCSEWLRLWQVLTFLVIMHKAASESFSPSQLLGDHYVH